MVQLALVPAMAAVLVACAVIVVAGPRMVRVADRLADATGWGEALVGAVLIGAATSLPGIVTTVVPAVRGLPELAVGNALGGILAQTMFLAIADLTYRRSNFEHVAVWVPNLVQAALLVALLGTVLVLFVAPPVTLWSVHLGSVVLVGSYLYGLRLVARSGDEPMWRAVPTTETRPDEPDEAPDAEVARGLWFRFAGYALVLAGAGENGHVGVTQPITKAVVDRVDGAIIGPAAEVAVHRLPRRQIVGQHPPRTAGRRSR